MVNSSADNIAASVGQLLVQVCRAHRNKAQDLLAAIDLYPGQEFLLYYLWPNDGLTQSELAEKLCVKPATLTRMLDRMEKSGYVERQADAFDQRISRVHLTESGRMLEAPVCETWGELEASTVAKLSLQERVELRVLLEKVLQSLTT